MLYVSGEESPQQIKMRAERLADHIAENIIILSETSLEKIFDSIKEVQPELLIVDSIQTVATETVASSAGSIAQIRECAAALLQLAKASGIPGVADRPYQQGGVDSRTEACWSTLWTPLYSLRATNIICTAF